MMAKNDDLMHHIIEIKQILARWEHIPHQTAKNTERIEIIEKWQSGLSGKLAVITLLAGGFFSWLWHHIPWPFSNS